MSWKDKKAEAEKLVAEVKALNAEGDPQTGGIDTGEKAQEAHVKVARAQELMEQVKAEKFTEDRERVDALLKQFDESEVPTPTAKAPIVQPEQKAAKSYSDEYDGDAGRIKMTVSRKAMDQLQLKALNEGSGGAGNFLVPPAYMQDLFAETRRQGNAIRRYGWLTEHPVETNQVLLPRGSGAATVGIVAENATKPSADQTYSQVTINVFTWAGISKVSIQLMRDSSPTAADLVSRELGTLLGNLEEQKIINGSGSGEPRGILNTTGTGSVTMGTNTGQAIIDGILDSIANVQQNYFAPPTGILIHPRRLAFLQKTKDTANNYVLNPPGMFRAPAAAGSGVTSQSEGTLFQAWSLFGIPVAVSTNIPTNLGGGTNQDTVIVAAWNEAHWFQRQDVTMDTSGEAGTAFEQNQIWFRLEERAGFSAERYPTAFCVGTGAGLIP